jgi:hypothetical protein
VSYGTGDGKDTGATDDAAGGAGASADLVEYPGVTDSVLVATPEDTDSTTDVAEAVADAVGLAVELVTGHKDGVSMIFDTTHDDASSVYSSK